METQTLDIDFGRGLSEKIDKTLLPNGALAMCQEAMFDKLGAMHKRHGFTNQSPSVTLAKGARLAVFENELIQLDGHILWSYEAKNPGWMGRDRIPEAQVTTGVLEHIGPGVIKNPVVAENLGIRVTAWTNSFLANSVWATVVDTTTGAVLIADFQLSPLAETQLQAVVIGNFIVLTYADGANIKGRRLDCTNPFTFAPQVVITATSGGIYDIREFDATAFHLALWDTGAGGQLVTARVNNALAITLSVVNGEVPTNCIACRAMDGVLYVAWHNAINGIRCLAKDPVTLAPVFGFTTVNATVAPISDQVTIARMSATSAAIIWTEKQGAVTRAFIRAREVTNAGALAGVEVNTYDVRLVSKAFEHDGHAMVMAQASGNTMTYTKQPTYFLLDLGIDNWTTAAQTFRVIGSCLQSFASQRGPAGLCPVAPVTGHAGQFTIAGQGFSIADADAVAGSAIGPLAHLLMRISIDLASDTRWQSAGFGQNTVFAGGVPIAYDGIGVSELGYHLYPEWLTATPAGAGGSLAPGTYGVAFVYDWFDTRGQRVISTPGFVTGIVVPGAGAGLITATCPNLNLTNKNSLTSSITRNPIRISAYITEAGGNVYYRNNAVLSINDPTSSTDITITFQTVDTKAEQLYTTGGVLENAAVPPSGVICNHRNRLWLVNGEDLRAVRYSKEMTVGIGAEFNQGLEVRIDDGGDITALASMDDKLVVFKASRIFFIAGEGAVNTGQGDSLAVEAILSETGCTDWRSIVVVPAGLMFRGLKGIYLLDRSLQLSYIGAPIEDTLAAYPTDTSATLVANTRQARFTCNTLANEDHRILVFDYLVSQWGTWHVSKATGVPFPICSAVIHQGVYKVAPTTQAAGIALFEDAATFYDDGSVYVSMRGRTGPLRAKGKQDWMRIRRATFLTQQKSAYSFAVWQYNNYPETAGPVSTMVFLSVNTQGLPVSTGQVGFKPKFQKCETVAFEFFDGPDDLGMSGSGEGYSISGITLEVGLEKVSFRLNPSARA